MSIANSIINAYRTMYDRKWDKVYWAIDLHGVCLESTYESNTYKWINKDVVAGLQAISARPESVIILWSSCYHAEFDGIIKFFKDENINVSYFNQNPEVPNTETGCFMDKFYFSVLLDDKAGFDPFTDWAEISHLLYGKILSKENFKWAK